MRVRELNRVGHGVADVRGLLEEFPVPTKMDPILMFWVSRFEVLSVALAMSRLPTGVPIGISIIWGGYFRGRETQRVSL